MRMEKIVCAQSGGKVLILKGRLKDAIRVLKAGGVVMHATETCYGLAADIFNQSAVQKIYVIKRMNRAKPVSIMVRGLAEAKKYASFNQCALEVAKKFWPGPVTLVLPRKRGLPSFLNPGHETVGIRCPDSAISQKLIKANGGPLVTTSANLSGKKEVYDVRDYLRQVEIELSKHALEANILRANVVSKLDFMPDLIIDDGLIPENLPSTIVAFEKGVIKLIRKGSLWPKIRQYCSKRAERIVVFN